MLPIWLASDIDATSNILSPATPLKLKMTMSSEFKSLAWIQKGNRANRDASIQQQA
jgi:hypothetical protein